MLDIWHGFKYTPLSHFLCHNLLFNVYKKINLFVVLDKNKYITRVKVKGADVSNVFLTYSDIL